MLKDVPHDGWTLGKLVASLAIASACGDIRAAPIVEIPSPCDGDAAPPTETTGQVALGDFHGCAIFDKKVRCWGTNLLNQLGDGTTIERLTATVVPDLPDALEIVVGPSFELSPDGTRSSHSCGRFADGTVRCWGPNVNGEGDVDTRASLFPRPTVMAGLDGAAQIAIGTFHTCVLIADGTVRCWGDGALGELGDGTLDWRATPRPVSGLSGVVEVAVTAGMSCARMYDRTVQCWGGTTAGSAGATTPAPVAGLTNVIQISGNKNACALKADGTAACWSGTDAIPQAVPGLTNAVRIVDGWQHTCAVISDGTMQCWGFNSSGQLGLGTTSDDVPTPTPVPGLTCVVDVTGQYWNTCARRRDGSVWCWGGNSQGQCGDGTMTTRLSPVRVELTP